MVASAEWFVDEARQVLSHDANLLVRLFDERVQDALKRFVLFFELHATLGYRRFQSLVPFLKISDAPEGVASGFADHKGFNAVAHEAPNEKPQESEEAAIGAQSLCLCVLPVSPDSQIELDALLPCDVELKDDAAKLQPGDYDVDYDVSR